MQKLLLIIAIIIFKTTLYSQPNVDSASIYFEQKDFDKSIHYCSSLRDYYKLYTLGNKLFVARDYKNSLRFYLKTFEIGEPYLNTASLLNILNVLGHNYQNISDYDNAEKFYSKAYELCVSKKGEVEEENIKFLNNLIVVYHNQKKYKQSTECYFKILNIQKAKFGEAHPDFVRSLYNIGWDYVDQKLYNQAENHFLKAIDIDYKIKDTLSIDYSNSLMNLYLFYGFNKLDYDKAELYLNKIIGIKRKILGINNDDYLESYEMLGFLYEKQKKIDDALNVFNSVFQKRKAKKNKAYIVTFSSIIRIKCFIDYDIQFIKLESLCKEYLKDAEIILGKNNAFYFLGLEYLASLYVNNDKLYLAQTIYEELIELKKIAFNNDINTIFPTYESLANIYVKEGNYYLAERIHKFVLEKKIESEVSKDEIARSYNNLATTYMDEFKYDLALSNYILAIEIIKKDYSEDRNDYALYLNNLGLLYIRINKFEEAERILLKSLEINEKINGQFSNSYLLCCTNLAALYEKTNKCKLAEKYYLSSINNAKNKNSSEYKNRFLGLSSVYFCLGSINYEKKYLILSSNFFLNDINLICYNYSSIEQDYLFDNILESRNFPLSFLKRNPFDKEIIEVALNEELILNHLKIHNQNGFKKSILNENDDELKLLYNQFLDNKKQIFKLNELMDDGLSKYYDSLILKTEKIEKSLIHKSKLVSGIIKKNTIKWNQLKDELRQNEIVVDIVNYKYKQNNNLSDSSFYAAFIVKGDLKFPKFIPLFEENQLDFFLHRKKMQLDSARINKHYLDKAISNLFIKPLEKELEGITTIYLSPSGLGHQINFAALPVSATQTLGEKYQVHILNSPAEIIDYIPATINKKNNTELLLYGGIDYNKSNGFAAKETTDKDTAALKEISELATRSGIASFGYLNGTNKEIEQIKIKGIESGFTTSIIKERDATEESIKQLDGRTNPYVLHLATHGFFFPDPEQQVNVDMFLQQGKSKVYKASDNPMLRSGLLLAGANNFWAKTSNNINIEDGILTASEISNLDLSACQLVVLSACETGLGEINGSEGVFGLQRAFKMAGVKNIIMSLWKVPDAQTAELFDIFYSECFAGKTIHQALQTAQSKMKSKYSPYYWAGFILLE